MFCAEIKALKNECVAKVKDTQHFQINRLLCCCIDKCGMVGFIIQTLAKEVSDSLDTY